MKKYYLIDYFRIIAAILVICIHTWPLSGISSVLNHGLVHCVARLAVPFFFCVTGFFMPKFEDCGKGFYLKKQILKILKIYLIWTAIFLPLIIIQKNSDEKILQFIQRMIFDGSYVHLWYLNAMIVGMIAFSVLKKVFNKKAVIIIATLCYVIGILGEAYAGVLNTLNMSSINKLISNTILNTRNGLLFAFPMLTLGYVFKDNEEKASITINTKIILLVIAFCVYILEAFFVKWKHFAIDYNRYATTPFVIWCLFLLLTDQKLNEKMPSDNHCTQIRITSSLVYFTHPYFIYLTNALFPNMDRLLFFSVVLLMSIIVSSVIFYLTKCKAFKFLKNLY